MNRRDMIIITVLLNVGLLSALLALAVSDPPAEPLYSTHPAVQAVAYKTAPLQQPLQSVTVPETVSVEKSLALSTSQPLSLTPIGAEEELDNVLRNFNGVASSPYFVGEGAKNIPSASPQLADVAEENFVEITVKPGDVLERIARANRTTIAAIKQANGLKTERLIVGQVLRVPVGKAGETQAVAQAVKTFPVAAVEEEEVFYVVKNGDNPWKIAKQFHVKFEDLIKLNGLDEERARNLRVGQRLRVR